MPITCAAIEIVAYLRTEGSSRPIAIGRAIGCVAPAMRAEGQREPRIKGLLLACATLHRTPAHRPHGQGVARDDTPLPK
jgi:uncharacterized protein YoaH (UPF0181 family)